MRVALDQSAFLLSAAVAVLMMVRAGVAKHALVVRTRACPACGRRYRGNACPACRNR